MGECIRRGYGDMGSRMDIRVLYVSIALQVLDSLLQTHHTSLQTLRLASTATLPAIYA